MPRGPRLLGRIRPAILAGSGTLSATWGIIPRPGPAGSGPRPRGAAHGSGPPPRPGAHGSGPRTGRPDTNQPGEWARPLGKIHFSRCPGAEIEYAQELRSNTPRFEGGPGARRPRFEGGPGSRAAQELGGGGQPAQVRGRAPRRRRAPGRCMLTVNIQKPPRR